MHQSPVTSLRLILLSLLILLQLPAATLRADDCNTNGVDDSLETTATTTLFWAQRNPHAIVARSLSGPGETTIVSGLQSPYYVIADDATQTVFWTEPGKISRADFDGGNVAVIRSALVNVGGIAIVGNKLYYTTNTNSLHRCNFDGTNVELMASVQGGSYLVAHDGFLYYADNATQRIYRINADGTGATTFVSSAPNTVHLSIDHIAERLYWLNDLTGSFSYRSLTSADTGVWLQFDMFHGIQGVGVDSLTHIVYFSEFLATISWRTPFLPFNNTLSVSSPAQKFELAVGHTITDCNTNGVLDECEVVDCNTNGVHDACDAAYRTDCNTDDIPDECELDDCDQNGVPDSCDFANGGDSNGDGVLDNCEDCNTNGMHDADEPGFVDCNTNSHLDICDLTEMLSGDCNTNGAVDECESQDCNSNDVPDECDIALNGQPDCDTNGALDACAPSEFDCDTNGVPDPCDLSLSASSDCNTNSVLDACEVGDPNVIYQSPLINFFNGDNAASYTILDAPTAMGNVHLQVRRTGDFNEAGEFYHVLVNGFIVESNIAGGPECVEQYDSVVVSADDWNVGLSISGNGNATITLQPTISVNSCGGSVQFVVRFVDPNFDCNTNGVPDACDLNLAAEFDVDSNGIIDACTDCDTNGLNDPTQFGYVDCNANNVLDDCDELVLPDDDNDLVFDECDNCPGLFNPEQMPWHDELVQGSGNFGQYNSLKFDSNGKATLAYYAVATTAVRLWHDDDGDLIATASEKVTIDTTGDTGEYISLAFDASGLAAISYYRADTGDLRFWHDDNGDFQRQPAEARTIADFGVAGQHTSLAYDAAGRATIAFFSPSTGSLDLWHDADGDNEFDPGEIQSIDATDVSGPFASLGFDPSGIAHIAYYSSFVADLRLWRDNDGDLAGDPGEIQTIDSSGNVGQYASLQFDEIGRVTVAYRYIPLGDLRVFHDANGNAAADPGEIAPILTSGNIGQYASLAFDNSGSAVVACYLSDSADLMIWRDLNQNFTFDGGESTVAASTGDVGRFASLAIQPSTGTPVVAYRKEFEASCMISSALDWDMDGICILNDPCPQEANGAPGDIDNDGDIDGDDLAHFLIAFGANSGDAEYSCGADADGSGLIDETDYDAWLDAYREFVMDPFALPPLPSNVGDLNLDGDVDGDDINLFVEAVVNPGAAGIPAFLLSDMNADGTLNAADVAAFASLLLS